MMKTTMKHKALVAGVAFLGALLSGCMSISTIHSARPIPKGTAYATSGLFAVGVEPTKDYTTVDDEGETQVQDLSFVWPSGEQSIRYGFVEWFDEPVAVYFPGIGIDLNFMVVNQKRFALSLDPSATFIYLYGGGAHLFVSTVWLPILMDVVETKYVTMTVGPKAGLLIVKATADVDDSIYSARNLDGYVGGVFGVKFKFGEEFFLMPEFDGVWQFEEQAFWWQAGISLGYQIL